MSEPPAKIARAASAAYAVNTKQVCAISYDEAKSEDKFLEWISIPTTQPHVYSWYRVKQLHEWFEFNGWVNVGDPRRGFETLDFMTSRLLALEEARSEHTIQEVNDLFKRNAVEEVVAHWLNGEPFDAYSLFIGIADFLSAGYLFCDMDYAKAKTALQSCQPGTFLVRCSAQHRHDNGHATVFTVSYVSDIGGVYHCRYLSVHAVGIYRLTPGRSNLPHVAISGMDCMHTLLLQDIMRDLRAMQYIVLPHSATFIDELHTLRRNGMINIAKMLRPH